MGGAVMPHPHMLHWDAAHPGGQMVPLRQPTLPVYYNTGPGQHMPGSGGIVLCSAPSVPQSVFTITVKAPTY